MRVDGKLTGDGWAYIVYHVTLAAFEAVRLASVACASMYAARVLITLMLDPATPPISFEKYAIK